MIDKLKVGAFGKVLVKYASTQVLYNGLKMLAGFLVVRLVAPEIYGSFSGIGVFLGYVMLGHLGIINGLGREIPFELGKKNLEGVDELAALGLWISYGIGILASSVFLFFLINKIVQGTMEEVVLYATFTIISFFHVLNKAYLPVLFRTNNEFSLLSNINIGLALSNIVSVLLVWNFGFLGLCYRALVLVIIEFALLYFYRPIKVKPEWNYNLLKSTFKTGLPIYAVGQVRPLWATVQNNLIFSLGGPLQFGYYALAHIINGALGVIPISISQVVYPKMTIQLGEGKSVATILRSIIKPSIFQFMIILFFALISYLALPSIVHLVLPKYANGIEVAQWVVFVPVIASLGLVNNIYNVVKQQKWYFVSLITGAVIGLGYSVLMVIQNGFNLVYFPQGMIIGIFIQVALSLVFLRKLKEPVDYKESQ